MMTTNKRANENFLVAKQGQTTLPSSGTISNTSTFNVNLADGQLGFVNDSIWGSQAINTFLDASPTIAEAPVVAIYQGNENSASMATATATYPLWVRPYERSAPIDLRNRVRVTKQAFRVPSHNVWVIGDLHGQADAVNVLSNTEYTMRIALRGYRVEEYYSEQQSAGIQAQITTPDFTALGYSTQQARSYILHNIAWQINRNSRILNMNGNRFTAKSPILALLISSAGGAGKAIGGGSPLATGDTVNVITSATTGTKSITVTEAMATSIKNAATTVYNDVIANVPWTIGVVDPSTASSVSPAIYDRLMLIALDETPAFVDYIPQVKTRIIPGFTSGFDANTVLRTEAVKADEGQGLARQLELLYQATQGQRKYSLRHVDAPVVNFPSPIISTVDYVVYNIMHGKEDQVDSLNEIYTPFREIVCIPRYSTGTTTNPYISTFETYLNLLLAASPVNNAIVSLD